MVSKKGCFKIDTYIYKVSRRVLKKLHSKKIAKGINHRYYKTDFKYKSKNKWIFINSIENKQLEKG